MAVSTKLTITPKKASIMANQVGKNTVHFITKPATKLTANKPPKVVAYVWKSTSAVSTTDAQNDDECVIISSDWGKTLVIFPKICLQQWD